MASSARGDGALECITPQRNRGSQGGGVFGDMTNSASLVAVHRAAMLGCPPEQLRFVGFNYTTTWQWSQRTPLLALMSGLMLCQKEVKEGTGMSHITYGMWLMSSEALGQDCHDNPQHPELHCSPVLHSIVRNARKACLLPRTSCFYYYRCAAQD